MNGRYLLDTNIIIALFADEAAVKNRLAQADEVFISSIAVGELCYGARKSGRSKENLERIDEFVANSTVLECDAQTAHYYGELKHNLCLRACAPTSCPLPTVSTELHIDDSTDPFSPQSTFFQASLNTQYCLGLHYPFDRDHHRYSVVPENGSSFCNFPWYALTY